MIRWDRPLSGSPAKVPYLATTNKRQRTRNEPTYQPDARCPVADGVGLAEVLRGLPA